MKHTLTLIFFLLTFSFCQSQKLNTIYYGVSSDSLYSGHQIEFKSDTTLELSTFPRHMSRQFKLTFNYKKVNKTLEIYNTKISLQDSTELIINRYGQFLKKLVFTIDGKALIDNSNNFVYVRYNDFKKKYFLNYLIDDKLYRQETGLPDAYGLIKNNPKNSKILQIKFNSIQDDLKNYTIKIYKGLDAYKKFGYKSVFGVIELKRKK